MIVYTYIANSSILGRAEATDTVSCIVLGRLEDGKLKHFGLRRGFRCRKLHHFRSRRGCKHCKYL